MSFGDAVGKCLREYGTFDGRATRSEFWWFYLFYSLVGLVFALPGMFLMIAGIPASDANAPGPAFWLGLVVISVGSLAQLALFVPTLAVGCRRLHDRGQSGWLQLLMLVPCGSLVLLVFWVQEGTPGDNAYGPKPA
jgi:uncharacterized membrane protein YhaH (DUF805 family)